MHSYNTSKINAHANATMETLNPNAAHESSKSLSDLEIEHIGQNIEQKTAEAMKLLKNMSASPVEQGRNSANSVATVQPTDAHVSNSFNPPTRTLEPRPQAAVSRPALAKESPTEMQKAKNVITQLQSALVANETSQIPDRMPAN